MEDTKDLISGKTIAVQIAEQLRVDILSRVIEPGSRITVKEIADRYNVSAMPVREAFNMLVGEQLLELNPYRGATVMAVTSELMAQLMMCSVRWKANWWNFASKRGILRNFCPSWNPSTRKSQVWTRRASGSAASI